MLSLKVSAHIPIIISPFLSFLQLLEFLKTCIRLNVYLFFNNNPLGEGQFGVRSLHSTALALGKVTNPWLLNLDSGRMTSADLSDIQKAFDTVDHQILFDKLRCYGITADQLVFFASYLNNCQQCCKVNGKLSSTKRIRCGIP